jgi:hypothetical protein
MATQKQRKRRAKEKRHDYDLVYIDEEGVEQPVERAEEPRKPTGRGSKATVSKSSPSKSSASKQPSRRSRAAKAAQPPSWSKVLKRGAIFAPIFLATVMLLGGNKMTFKAAVVQTVLLISVFIPFSYFMDRVVWRQQQKRLARGA